MHTCRAQFGTSGAFTGLEVWDSFSYYCGDVQICFIVSLRCSFGCCPRMVSGAIASCTSHIHPFQPIFSPLERSGSLCARERSVLPACSASFEEADAQNLCCKLPIDSHPHSCQLSEGRDQVRADFRRIPPAMCTTCVSRWKKLSTSSGRIAKLSRGTAIGITGRAENAALVERESDEAISPANLGHEPRPISASLGPKEGGSSLPGGTRPSVRARWQIGHSSRPLDVCFTTVPGRPPTSPLHRACLCSPSRARYSGCGRIGPVASALDGRHLWGSKLRFWLFRRSRGDATRKDLRFRHLPASVSVAACECPP